MTAIRWVRLLWRRGRPGFIAARRRTWAFESLTGWPASWEISQGQAAACGNHMISWGTW
ncbi:hypothetical protein BDA96_02G375500 [Sorghum bicolor]|uniref:Uncharacterized protein n=2 Tax=Sorghum bicolor TaxID=4558 RepID=A0A921RSB0_SORBI|nr:hypothetical protein BDA96_02G375500 [Sorghum bicolor]KXG36587.1 hypothetical protein SORBI_3002G358200 [Sorghum bicolor]